MTLIDRYVMGTFLRVLSWSVLAFVMLFLLLDLFDHLDNFLDDNASVLAILRYYFYQVPMVVDLCLPVGMLLASLFTVGILSKNNEYGAMLSAGVSLLRVTRGLLIMGLLMAVAAMALNEFVVPASNRIQDDIKKYEIEGKIRQDLRGKRNFTYVGQRGEVYVINRFRPDPPMLEGFSMQTFQDSTMIRRVDAQRAVWMEDHWQLELGAIRSFGETGEAVTTFDSRPLEESQERPADFSRRDVDPETMNYRELNRFADWVTRTGGDPVPYRAEMAHKISFPLVNFLLVVLGLALGAARKKTTLWAGFGLTVGLAFAYWILMDFGLTLGKSGAVPIWASAWTGNILYGCMGLALFWRANR